MIYIRTCAFNAEKTIARAIESVLSQTSKDFLYYILDNGSIDSTREIIKQYAMKDCRIVPFYSDKNMSYYENNKFWMLPHNLNEDDYFVSLDADDYYEKTFLEECMMFMNNNKLDVVACGTQFFQNEVEGGLDSRVLKKELIIKDENSYNDLFSIIHWNLRQEWGKIYSGKVVKGRCDGKKPEWWPKAYGGDTVNVLLSLENANGIGIYPKVLHYYQVSKKSVSHRWVEGRENSDVILHEMTLNFLKKKAGVISKTNYIFIMTVYLNAIIDTLKVLNKAELDVWEKLSICAKIFSNKYTMEALIVDFSVYKRGGTLQKIVRDIKKQYLDALMYVASNINMEHMSFVGKFLASYNTIFDTIVSEEHIYEYLRKLPQLIYKLALYQYDDLFKIIETYMLEDEKNIVLAQNIAAYVSNEEKYIKYSKVYIKNLIDNDQNKKALEEINEWIQILENDEELIMMKESLINMVANE